MATFKHEIKYISNVLEGLEVKKKRIKKIVTFKELDETDIDQHDLHFKIMSLYQTKTGLNEKDKTVKIDTKVLREITVESVKLLAVTDEHFTNVDLSEFLASSLGLINFGVWFLEAHVIPFVITYND